MGIFGKLTSAIVQTALLPVALAKDVVTMGGACIDEDPATWERLKKIGRTVESAIDELDD